MMHFASWAFSIAVGLGVYIWLCLPGARWRETAVLAFVALTMAAYAAVVESAGQPKPLLLEWRDVINSPIVGMTYNEELRVVWLWVMHDGQPVSYSLPWPADQKKFGELQDRWRRKGVTGDEFELSMDGDVAKVRPPQPNPEKTE